MSLFKDHGTKILGAVTTLIGALSASEPTLLIAALGQKGVSYLMALSGILTILRGLQNTKNQSKENPPS